MWWIEVGRQGTAGAASDGGFARLCSRELEEGKGMDGTGSFPGLREEKSDARTASLPMLDAWRSSPASRHRFGRWASTVTPQGRIVNGLTNFLLVFDRL